MGAGGESVSYGLEPSLSQVVIRQVSYISGALGQISGLRSMGCAGPVKRVTVSRLFGYGQWETLDQVSGPMG